MARIHPSTPGNDVSIAERRVFDRFARDLPEDWIVLHGRRVVVPSADRRPPVESEADFLVIDPARGCVVIEVKGGTDIGADAEGWFSIDSRGNRKSIKEPAAQAQRVMHTMMAYVARLRGNRMPSWERRMGWGVAFPDFEVGPSPDAGLPREMLLDRRDLESPREALERMFDAHGIERRPMGEDALRLLLDALRPCFLLMRPLAARIQQQEPAFFAMTDEQVRVVEACWQHPRLSVRGVAGSGKTFVAMELAQRLANEGQRALFLCFNAPLARRVADALDGPLVRTFHSFVWDCAQKAGLSSRIPEKPRQDYYESESPKLLLDALLALPDERFDAVVIDEGQDFRAAWWQPIVAALRDASQSGFHVFWDPDQDLHGGGPTPGLGLFPLRLDYNCRNTRRIATYAARFATQQPKFRPESPMGDEVELVSVKDRDAIPAAAGALLERLVDQEGVDPKQIVVLSPLSRERSSFGSNGKAGRFALADLDSPQLAPDEVRFSTVHRFKGLEAEVAVLCDVDVGEEWSGRIPLHVGCSRARHYLAVVGTNLPPN